MWIWSTYKYIQYVLPIDFCTVERRRSKWCSERTRGRETEVFERVMCKEKKRTPKLFSFPFKLKMIDFICQSCEWCVCDKCGAVKWLMEFWKIRQSIDSHVYGTHLPQFHQIFIAILKTNCESKYFEIKKFNLPKRWKREEWSSNRHNNRRTRVKCLPIERYLSVCRVIAHIFILNSST